MNGFRLLKKYFRCKFRTIYVFFISAAKYYAAITFAFQFHFFRSKKKAIAPNKICGHPTHPIHITF